MNPDDADRLRSIKSFPQLVKYLRDELAWPIESDDYDELMFEYQPEELGLDTASAVKVKEIKQLRPLHTNQPWGVFFVNFEPKRLPVVVLRRILSALVVKKRQSRPSQAAWSLHDLLFISSYGESSERTITFAHFSEGGDDGDLPTLRVLAWDDQDTVLHLADAHRTLCDKLRYPDIPEDAETWRKSWSSAFTLRHREVITTSKALAVRLAELATAIRKRANAVLIHESEKGPLRKLHIAFRQSLIHDLSADDFADMYAQTIAYGLLTARVSRPAGLVADNLANMVPITNPFLKDLLGMFLTVGGRKGKLDFDELGVNDVVELLRTVNMEAVLRDFGDRNPQEDPVIHFYELFLKEYDPKKRMKRGVFYTPRPVVSYIVRSVHELLQTEFGLEDGLASTVTWAEMAKPFPPLPPGEGRGEGASPSPSQAEGDQGGSPKGRGEGTPFDIPAGTDPNSPFVVILDPAIGTATFLVEVIDVIHKTMKGKWLKEGRMELEIPKLWNEYVPKHLLPRLYGYELMMAPYAIAHMKIGLKLHETGYRFGSDERARVYLTNSLEPPSDDRIQREFEEWSPALAHEAQAVNAVKRNQRFTVVIGNPPYSVLSANLSETSRRIVDLYRYVDGEKIEERSMLRLEMHLQDDYVKFLAFSQNILDYACAGVLGFITNNGYLDNLTLRGVRFALQKQFSRAAILNLHGSRQRRATSTSEADENVFDIEQGVAVFLGAAGRSSALRQYTDLTGSRDRKYERLLNERISTTRFESLTPRTPQYFLVPRNNAGLDEYETFVSLVDAMPVNISGIVTAHDDLVVDFGDDRLVQNAAVLRDRTLTDGEARGRLGVKDNAGWKLSVARAEMRKTTDDKFFLKPYAYRPYDTRRIYYHADLVWCDRRKVMSHTLAARNLALATCRQLARLPWDHVFVTRNLQDDCFISNRTRERSYHFPLHLHGESRQRSMHAELTFDKSGASTNFSVGFLTALGSQISPAGEDVFSYIYGVLHSPQYRARYAEFLRIDFPRLPLTGNLELFRALARLGGELVALHLVESPIQTSISVVFDRDTRAWRYQYAEGCKPPIVIRFTGPAEPVVEKVSYASETVWIDKAQRVGFAGVPEGVWNFHIGGYQVCHKWLKDRKGRVLSADDITHYHRIVVALHETIRLMAEIDKTIDAHGGWPAAFAAAGPGKTHT